MTTTTARTDSVLDRILLVTAALQAAITAVLMLFSLRPGVSGSATEGIWRGGLAEFTLLAFALSGSALLAGGLRRDARVRWLGGALLLAAPACATAPLPGESTNPATVLGWLLVPTAAAFAPVFVWRFARAFPATTMPFRQQRRFGLAIKLAWSLGWLVLLGRVAVEVASWLGTTADPRFHDGLRWIGCSAALGACWALVMRARQAPEGMGRTATVLTGLATGLSIAFVDHFTGRMLPALRTIYDAAPRLDALRFAFAYTSLLAVPTVALWAVYRHRVLDVRPIAGRPLRYGAARIAVLSAVGAPFVLALAYLVQHRHLPLAAIARGPHVIVLGGLLTLGVLTLRYRLHLLDAIDRRFFRERYNARRILERLVEQIRSARHLRELAGLVTRGVDLALHLERVSLLVEEPELGQLVDPREGVRPLDLGARLSTLVHSNKQPLLIDFDTESSPIKTLSEAERHWLVDAKAHMLVPSYDGDGRLIGLLVLGAKRSEQAFLREDRQLLTAIATSAGLVIELLRLRERDQTPVPDARPGSPVPTIQRNRGGPRRAHECLRCGCVYPPHLDRCTPCGQTLEDSVVPYVLPRRFRFEQRIGTGGMAVVYRAMDVTLGRTVAIKTLPRVSPEAAQRLHREARAAASVAHPGLAAIYGMETWEGMPMLILELLEGGTLADRITDGVLEAADIVRTGQAVARALDTIHAAGILHRDIKPSNIGYTRDRIPKLLDFGIARIQSDLRREPSLYHPSTNTDLTEMGWGGSDQRTDTGQIVGTLSYLSPEALAGAKAEPSFDLWSLTVVLYEAATGQNLFYGPDLVDLLERIRSADVPDVRTEAPDCPEALAHFFRRALHREPSQRPQSGADYDRALESVRRSLIENVA